MNINRHNYEAFFIDYYDGNLSAAQKQVLEMFLSDNPDLKEEFEQFESVPVPLHEITFSGKQQLKKREIVDVEGISEENYEEAFIAFYEKDLNDTKQKSLQVFLEANPHLRKEFELHGSLVLAPDAVTYTGKKELKKKAAIGYYWYAGAAAAVILVFLTLNFLIRQNTSVRRHAKIEIAHMNPQDFSGTVLQPLPGTLMKVSFKEVPVSLPEPEPLEKEKIFLLASADIDPVIFDSEFQLPKGPIMNHPAEVQKIIKPKQRSLLAQVFRKNLSNVKDKFGIELNRRERNKKNKNKKDPGFIRFLDGSLMVFNTITGSDTDLVKNYDKNGNLKNYRLEGQNLIVSRKLPAGGGTE